MQKFKQRKGFSLMEMIVVIAIIGVIAAIVFPSIMLYLNYAKKNQALTEATQIKEDLNSWYALQKDKTDEIDIERGKNLIFDFVDYEINKDSTAQGSANKGIASKLTVGFIPGKADTLYRDFDDDQEINKYLANTSKEKFSLTNDAMIIYNNGTYSCAIVLPLTSSYYFTGSAFVYGEVYKSDDALLKKYCGIPNGIKAADDVASEEYGKVFDLVTRKVNIDFKNINGTQLGTTIVLNSGASLEESNRINDIPTPETTDFQTPSGYTFNNKWKISGTDIVLTVDQLKTYKVTRNLILLAQYDTKQFAIYFYENYKKGDVDYYNQAEYISSNYTNKVYDNPEPILVSYNELLKYNEPMREGYNFTGWVLDNFATSAAYGKGDINHEFNEANFPNLNSVKVFDKTMENDATEVIDGKNYIPLKLYAKWEAKKMRVELMSFNSGIADTIEVEYGQKIDLNKYSNYFNLDNDLEVNSNTKDLVNIGVSSAYSSWSWFTGDRTANKFNVDQPIRRDMTLYAFPNYTTYISSTTNGLFDILDSTTSVLYFRIKKDLIKDDERFAIIFYNTNDNILNASVDNLELLDELVENGISYLVYSKNIKDYASKTNYRIIKYSSTSNLIDIDGIIAITDAQQRSEFNTFYIDDIGQNPNVSKDNDSSTIENLAKRINYQLKMSLNKTNSPVAVSKLLLDNTSNKADKYDIYLRIYNGNSDEIIGYSLFKNYTPDTLYADFPESCIKYDFAAFDKGYSVNLDSIKNAKMKSNNIFTRNKIEGSNEYENINGKILFVTKLGGTDGAFEITNNSSTIGSTVFYDISKVAYNANSDKYKYPYVYYKVKGQNYYTAVQISKLKQTLYQLTIPSEIETFGLAYSSKYINASAQLSKSDIEGYTNFSTSTGLVIKKADVEGKTIVATNINTGAFNYEISDSYSSKKLEDFSYSCTKGSLMFVPQNGSMQGSLDDGDIYGYIIVESERAFFKVCSTIGDANIWLGYSALDDDSRAYCQKYGDDSINLPFGRYKITFSHKKDTVFYGVPRIKIEPDEIYQLFYYYSTGLANVSAATEIVQKGETGTYFDSLNARLNQEGYTFEGKWYADEKCTIEYDRNTVLTQDTAIYAKMIPNKYDINYEFGDNVTISEEEKAKFIKSYTYDRENSKLPVPVDEKGEYKFDGWYLKDTLTERTDYISKTEIKYAVDGVITVYAKWSKASYLIAYNYDGGRMNEGQRNPTLYVVGQESIVLLNPIRTGYTFAGWYDNKELKGDKVEILDCKDGGRIDLFAKWNLDDPNLIEVNFSSEFNGTNKDYTLFKKTNDNGVEIDKEETPIVIGDITEYPSGIDNAEGYKLVAKFEHEIDSNLLELNFKWLREDTKKDENGNEVKVTTVISESESVDVLDEGDFVYYLVVNCKNETKKYSTKERTYRFEFKNVYSSSFDDATVTWDGQPHVLELNSTYRNLMERNNFVISDPIIYSVNENNEVLLSEDNNEIIVNEAVEPGKYKFVYKITGGSTAIEDKVAYLTINKVSLSISTDIVFEFNDKNQEVPMPSNLKENEIYDESRGDTEKTNEVLEISNGVTIAKDVGRYRFTATICDPDHYEWVEEENKNIVTREFEWVISKKKIDAPYLLGNDRNKEYTGEEITFDPSILMKESSLYEIVEENSQLKGTEMGVYQIVLHLLDPDTCWNDGSINDVIVNWEIIKANPKLKDNANPKVITKYQNDSLVAGDSSDFIEGSYTMIYGDNKTCEGTLTWKYNYPSLTYSSVEYNYEATFVPNDQEHFNSVDISVPLKVEKYKIKLSNIDTLPQCEVYYSSYDSVSEATLIPGKVLLEDGSEILGQFEWKEPNKKYAPAKEGENFVVIPYTFIPLDNNGYEFDLNEDETSLTIKYIVDSYTVTVNGYNGNINSFTLNYIGHGNTEKNVVVSMGEEREIEVNKENSELKVTVNSMSRYYEFSGLIYDDGVLTSPIKNQVGTSGKAYKIDRIERKGTLILMTNAKEEAKHEITFDNNREDLQMEISIKYEDYDNYFVNGKDIYSVKSINSNDKVAPGTMVTVKYTMEPGYKLASVEALEQNNPNNLIAQQITAEDNFVDTCDRNFVMKNDAVTVSGTTIELKVDVHIEIGGTGYAVFNVEIVKGNTTLSTSQITTVVSSDQTNISGDYTFKGNERLVITPVLGNGVSISNIQLNGEKIAEKGESNDKLQKLTVSTIDSKNNVIDISYTLETNEGFLTTLFGLSLNLETKNVSKAELCKKGTNDKVTNFLGYRVKQGEEYDVVIKLGTMKNVELKLESKIFAEAGFKFVDVTTNDDIKNQKVRYRFTLLVDSSTSTLTVTGRN